MPVKPSSAAISAMTRNTAAYCSISLPPIDGQAIGHCHANARSAIT
jgi:hypothetical protein